MAEKIKKGLLAFLMALMLLPLLQMNFHFIDSGRLYGFYSSASNVGFNVTSWWRGTYQEKKQAYLNDNVGFRPDLIRLVSQVDFSLFHSNRFGAEVGADHSLWFRNYIDAYTGRDYTGYQPIAERLHKLKKLQDTLARLGKTLILVHAPNKGYFYPELLPGKDQHVARTITNLETYTRLGDSLGINQVDFNAWMMSLKNKTPHLLYPRLGTHWSVYASYLAADSLVRYMEHKAGTALPHFYCAQVKQTTDAQSTDDDLARPLNLIFPYFKEVYSYPELRFPGTTARKPKVIYIGDSFTCQWLYLWIPQNINDNYQFWCRFDEVCNAEHPYGDMNCKHITDINWIAELEKTDFVVLVYTAINLHKLGNGFIEQAYAHYFPQEVTSKKL